MKHTQEITAEDVHKSMMELERLISADKQMIRDDNNDDKAFLSFSNHIFLLAIKRLKHRFYVDGEFAKGNKIEELVEKNEEPISHHISANAIKAMMNVNLYAVSLEDTFMELLKETLEYLKPILSAAIQ